MRKSDMDTLQNLKQEKAKINDNLQNLKQGKAKINDNLRITSTILASFLKGLLPSLSYPRPLSSFPTTLPYYTPPFTPHPPKPVPTSTFSPPARHNPPEWG